MKITCVMCPLTSAVEDYGNLVTVLHESGHIKKFGCNFNDWLSEKKTKKEDR